MEDRSFFLFRRVLCKRHHEQRKIKEMEKEKRNVSAYRKKQVAASQGWTCAMCKQILDANFETDHIIPLHQGGSNDISNLQSLCPNCHSRKTLEEREPAGTAMIVHYYYCSKCRTQFSPYFRHACSDKPPHVDSPTNHE